MLPRIAYSRLPIPLIFPEKRKNLKFHVKGSKILIVHMFENCFENLNWTNPNHVASRIGPQSHLLSFPSISHIIQVL